MNKSQLQFKRFLFFFFQIKKKSDFYCDEEFIV